MPNSLTAQNSGLTKMRRVATGVLLALAATFLATHFVSDPPAWVLLIRAMAEAGMVGGLADWFAVEALFRHPLGLPIPHTALLPSNQDRAAHNVGEFFDTYFMDPAQLRERLTEVNPVLRLAEWLSVHENAQFITRQITGILASLFQSGIGNALAPKSAKFLKKSFLASMDSKEVASKISDLLKESLHGNILNELLVRIQAAIDENRDQVVKLVEDRSRWWIAPSVDQRIAGVLVDGVISVIQELGSEKSELRGDFENSITHMIDEFERDGLIAEHIDQGKKQFAKSDAFQELTGKLFEAVQDRIAERLQNNPEEFAEMLAGPVQQFAQHLLENDQLRTEFNTRLFDAFEGLLTRLRPALSAYITETIANWDSAELIDRFESAVGRDLQFIRINGAVLGAFIGGVLFFFGVLVE